MERKTIELLLVAALAVAAMGLLAAAPAQAEDGGCPASDAGTFSAGAAPDAALGADAATAGPAERTITATVYDADGIPLEGMWVAFYDSKGKTLLEVGKTGPDGKIELTAAGKVFWRVCNTNDKAPTDPVWTGYTFNNNSSKTSSRLMPIEVDETSVETWANESTGYVTFLPRDGDPDGDGPLLSGSFTYKTSGGRKAAQYTFSGPFEEDGSAAVPVTDAFAITKVEMEDWMGAKYTFQIPRGGLKPDFANGYALVEAEEAAYSVGGAVLPVYWTQALDREFNAFISDGACAGEVVTEWQQFLVYVQEGFCGAVRLSCPDDKSLDGCIAPVERRIGPVHEDVSLEFVVDDTFVEEADDLVITASTRGGEPLGGMTLQYFDADGDKWVSTNQRTFPDDRETKDGDVIDAGTIVLGACSEQKDGKFFHYYQATTGKGKNVAHIDLRGKDVRLAGQGRTVSPESYTMASASIPAQELAFVMGDTELEIQLEDANGVPLAFDGDVAGGFYYSSSRARLDSAIAKGSPATGIVAADGTLLDANGAALKVGRSGAGVFISMRIPGYDFLGDDDASGVYHMRDSGALRSEQRLVTVTVTDADGEPIPGAWIAHYEGKRWPAKPAYDMCTDAYGECSFPAKGAVMWRVFSVGDPLPAGSDADSHGYSFANGGAGGRAAHMTVEEGCASAAAQANESTRILYLVPSLADGSRYADAALSGSAVVYVNDAMPKNVTASVHASKGGARVAYGDGFEIVSVGQAYGFAGAAYAFPSLEAVEAGDGALCLVSPERAYEVSGAVLNQDGSAAPERFRFTFSDGSRSWSVHGAGAAGYSVFLKEGFEGTVSASCVKSTSLTEKLHCRERAVSASADMEADFLLGEPRDLGGAGVEVAVSGVYVYDGSEQAVAYTVMVDGAEVPAGMLAAASGGAGVGAGGYSLVLAPADSCVLYAGETAPVAWEIAPKQLDDPMIAIGETALIYDGSEQRAVFAVADGGVPLVLGEDYVIVDGTDAATGAGAYILKIAGAGNYAGEASAEWEIAPKQLEDAMVSVGEIALVYDGSEQRAVFAVADGGVPLALGEDYAVVDGTDAAIDAGAHVLKIAGAGNYAGEASAEWEIAPKQLEDAMVSVVGEPIVFDGEEHRVAFSVADGDALLIPGKDYTVVDGTDAATDVGAYVLKIAGAGNYAGEASAGWSVFPEDAADLAGAVVEVAGEYTYTGAEQTAVFTVKVGGADVPAEEVAVKFGGSGTDAGAYELVVKARDGSLLYKGEAAPVEWRIAPKQVDAADIEVVLGSAELVYDGSEQGPAVASVTAGGVELPSEEYSVSGGMQTDAGDYTLTVKLCRNYAGEKSVAWSIAPKALEDSMIAVADAPVVFDGEEQKVAFTVADGDALLAIEKDYVVVDGDVGTEAGTYILKIAGAGNYAGEASVGWEIAPEPADLAGAVVEVTGEYAYTGAEQRVAFTVKVGDADVSAEVEAEGGSATDAGAYELKVRAKEGSVVCRGEAAPVVWEIAPKALEDSMVAVGEGPIVYDGEEQKVAFTVADGDAMLAIEKDYVVAEGGAGIDAGTYILKVAGAGNYAGEASAEWTIAPKALEDSMIAVDGKPVIADGTEQKAAFAVADGDALLAIDKDYIIVEGDAGTEAGTYILKVSGTGNYAGEASAEWTVEAPVEDGGLVYIERGGAVQLARVPAGSADVAVPESVDVGGTPRPVESVAPGAFAGNADLRSVVLPASVAEIMQGAFEGCASLEKVTISDSVGSVAPDAFRGCGAVVEVVVTLPAGGASGGALLGPAALGDAASAAPAAANVLAREWRLPGQETQTVKRIVVDGPVDLSDVAAFEGRELVILSEGTVGGTFLGDSGEALEGADRVLGGGRCFVSDGEGAWKAAEVQEAEGGSGLDMAHVAVAALAVVVLAAVLIAAVRLRR